MPTRQIPEFEILTAGGQPFDKFARVLSIQRSTGGQRLDHAVLQSDLAKSGQRISHIELAAKANQMIEIWGKTDSKRRRLFWGQVVRASIRISGDQEAIEFVARVEPFHFGEPLSDRAQLDTTATQFQFPELPIVFNPLIDGRVYGNMRTQKGPSTSYVFIDAESLRTTGARTLQSEHPEYDGTQPPDPNLWTFSRAIDFLCQATNGDEPFVKNPTLEEIQRVVDDERDILRNLEISYGVYLPQALDELLQPLGYSWFVAPAGDYQAGGGTSKPKLKIFKRAEGTEQVEVALQDVGEQLDTQKSNLAACNLEFDLSTTYNRVLCQGGFIELEATYDLSPGWDPRYDDLTSYPAPGAFQLLSSKSPGFLDGPYYNVYRKWVLNEGGDYTSTGRPSQKSPYDFSQLAAWSTFDGVVASDAAVVRRRRFLPCLTLGPDNQPIGHVHGCRVTYQNPLGQWTDVPGECCLLHTECGIYFHGDLPPLRMMSSTGGFIIDQTTRIRVTATVRFDLRLRAESEDEKHSPLGSPHTLYLNLSHRFKLRKLDPSSEFAGDVASGAKRAYWDDDTQAMQDYADALLKTWNTAALCGQLTIEGVDDWRDDPAYELGQSVTQIAGREIKLKTSTEQQDDAYPQIVGLSYDYQRQTTTLQLERYRESPRFLREAEGTALPNQIEPLDR